MTVDPAPKGLRLTKEAGMSKPTKAEARAQMEGALGRPFEAREVAMLDYLYEHDACDTYTAQDHGWAGLFGHWIKVGIAESNYDNYCPQGYVYCTLWDAD